MSAYFVIVLIIVCSVMAMIGLIFLVKKSGPTSTPESRLVQWTIILAIASWFGVATAIWSVWQLRVDLRDVVNATISFELDKEFDSDQMRNARRALAKELLEGKQDLVETRVLDFFEKVATYERLGRIDTYTADSSYSYFVERYWRASQGFIAKFRSMERDDTYFQDFERLNMEMLARDARERHRKVAEITPSESEVGRFLREEARLP